MSDQMRNSELVALERSLRALADEDLLAQAPSHVHAAVMQTWDVVGPVARPRRRMRSRTVARLAVGSMAAAIVAVVVMYRVPSKPTRPEPIVAPATEKPRVVTTVGPATSETLEEAPPPRPRRPRTRSDSSEPPYGSGIVLVADPIVDASATSIVRVRVPRRALVTLGIPLVEPDDGGSVDLEMLVGEDGVARTIRRAMPVATRPE
jgi:hypothetical protein